MTVKQKRDKLERDGFIIQDRPVFVERYFAKRGKHEYKSKSISGLFQKVYNYKG